MSTTVTSQVLSGESASAREVLRRGVELSPSWSRASADVLLAMVATAGRVLVPIAVQQGVDNGISGPDGPRRRTSS